MNSEQDNIHNIIRKFEPFLKGLSFFELTILNKLVVDRIKLVQKAGTLVSMSQFHVGDRVSWEGSDGVIRKGTVMRLNQKTISVKTGDQGYWNISPQFLRIET